MIETVRELRRKVYAVIGERCCTSMNETTTQTAATLPNLISAGPLLVLLMAIFGRSRPAMIHGGHAMGTRSVCHGLLTACCRQAGRLRPHPPAYVTLRGFEPHRLGGPRKHEQSDMKALCPAEGLPTFYTV
jgi:hypothetical protein